MQQVEMDETERALITEANAAGAPGQPPAGGEPDQALPPPATGDAVMEIEEDEEPEQMKIVRDYKRPEQRQAIPLLRTQSSLCDPSQPLFLPPKPLHDQYSKPLSIAHGPNGPLVRESATLNLGLRLKEAPWSAALALM